MATETIRRQHRWTITPEHLILDPRVSDRAMRLWCRLDRYAGDNGAAFPSRLTLAIELDTSKASIDRAIKELCESGWLVKTRRREGDVNDYTLIVAPEKTVQKLIEKAREERWAAAAPQLERERELRRKQKRAQHGDDGNVQSCDEDENVQVSEGGVLTGDDTPDPGGVVTHDETPVVTGDETSHHPRREGVLTGDEEKEASGKEASGRNNLALAPLDAPQITPQLVLLVTDEPVTGEIVDADPAAQRKAWMTAARDLVTVWIDHWNAKAPVLKSSQTFNALVKSYVVPALEVGYTDDEIKQALVACGKVWPSDSHFREALLAARGGVPPVAPSSRTASNQDILARAMARAQAAEAAGAGQ